MSDRVLSTITASTTIQRMATILSGQLVEQVRQLEQQGQTLSDSNVWDGHAATQFRTQVWPQAKTALDRTVQTLEELRIAVQKVNANIMSAGGNT
ncbi:MAG TPA: pyrophosphorylase [Candidatus Dormibacteraeota bacterium]